MVFLNWFNFHWLGYFYNQEQDRGLRMQQSSSSALESGQAQPSVTRTVSQQTEVDATDHNSPSEPAEANNRPVPEIFIELANSETEEQSPATPDHSPKPTKSNSSERVNKPLDPLEPENNPHIDVPSPTKLRERLQAARIEYPPDSHKFFIPNSVKDDIVTENVVTAIILAGHPGMSTEKAQGYAKKVCSKSKKLFAVLAYMGKGEEVCAFLDEGISDKDFPFERSKDPNRKCKFSLQQRNRKTVQVMEGWTSFERETFGKEQWLMLAPLFKDKEHYKLHSNMVLPFICASNEQLPNAKRSGGGYSEVFFAQIHNSHYWEPKAQHLNVAIKRLLTKDEAEFKNERDILKRLGSKSKPHPHLVTLLASFEINGEFFLIFPRAKCNLRSYWDMHPDPAFDNDTVLWSLEQMMGMANALNIVHNFKVSYPPENKEKRSSSPRALKLSVTPKEAPYGRHGDIKPENIIFFEQGAGYTNHPRGILQITDFGLGRFHGHDSKTEQWPHRIVGSPTYEPPEYQLCRPVSRVYDLWSLGCLYLEFATWLLMGAQCIMDFSERRAKPPSDGSPMTDDLFFTITKDADNAPVDAKIREGVEEWVRELHQHPRCSDFTHDLLDLVMKDLLCIQATNRIHTSELCARFKAFRDKAVSSEEYLCAGRPREPENFCTDAIGIFSKSAESMKFSFPTSSVSSRLLKQVSFTSEPEEIRQTFRAHKPARLSLPSILKKKKSATWPQLCPLEGHLPQSESLVRT